MVSEAVGGLDHHEAGGGIFQDRPVPASVRGHGTALAVVSTRGTTTYGSPGEQPVFEVMRRRSLGARILC
jgi:hypothetical protein